MISPEIIFSEIFTTRKLNVNGDDYKMWKHKILFIFSNKGIDYVLHQPQPPKDESPTSSIWIRDNAKASNLILRSTDLYLPYNLSTAKSMMDYLETLFNFKTPSIGHLILPFRQYITRRMDENTNISNHVLDMQADLHELEMVGVKVPDEMQAAVLMNSLPASWYDVVYLLNLQLKENELGFDNVSQRLRVAAEMMPRRISNNPGYKGYCCLCRQFGHNLLKCPEDQKSNSNNNLMDETMNVFETMNGFDTHYLTTKMSGKLNYTGTNFFSWKCKLSLILGCSNLNYVLEQPKPPTPTDSTLEQDVVKYNKWLADDVTCRHIILGLMEDNLFLTFQSQPTAKALLDKLDAWFDFPSLGRRMALLKQYVEWHMSEHTRINDHICKMTRMVKELKRGGIDVPDDIQAVVLIESLPRSWDDLKFGMRMRIDKEIEEGAKLLDSAIKTVRNFGMIQESRMNSNNRNP